MTKAALHVGGEAYFAFQAIYITLQNTAKRRTSLNPHQNSSTGPPLTQPSITLTTSVTNARPITPLQHNHSLEKDHATDTIIHGIVTLATPLLPNIHDCSIHYQALQTPPPSLTFHIPIPTRTQYREKLTCTSALESCTHYGQESADSPTHAL